MFASLFKFATPRVVFVGVALVAASLMGFALYLQEAEGQHPCALCITQRIFMVAVGVIALLAALHNPGRIGRVIYAGLSLLAALCGAIVAGRHVWLQHLPEDQVPACGPGLNYLFENFPLQKAVNLLFMGDGNCADIGWTLLGLSIPNWTLMAFVGFAVLSVWQLLRKA